MLTSQHPEFTPWPHEFEQKYKAKGYWQDLTLFDCLTETVKKFAYSTAIVCGEKEVSYLELHDKASDLASGLTKQGLVAGDSAVLQMTNEAEFYYAFFALTLIGVRPVLALPAHRHRELSYFCNHSNAKAYLYSSDISGLDTDQAANKLLEDCPSLTLAISTTQSQQENILWIDDLYIRGSFAKKTDASQVAFYQLSGGTTGTPKLIPRTHNDYIYSVKGSIDICDFDYDTKYLCVLPVAHNFPLSSPGALGVLFSGGCVVLCKDPSPQTAFRLIQTHKVNVSALVPPLALLWMQYAETAEENISSLKLVQVGGAKFSQSAAEKLPSRLDCQLQQVFGMAEGLVNYTRLDDPIEVITQTQGRPISDSDEVMVVDENGQPVESGVEGQLLTRGPYTIRGYFKAGEHNQRSFTSSGFYRTGDLVKLTAEGNIVVTGRDKDQINRGGEKIAAEEVENVLLQHEQIHDAALIAIDDEFLGERTCAIIVLEQTVSEAKLKPIAVKRFLLNQGLAEFKIPDQVRFTDTLPKTPVGKINKKLLRQEFAKN